MLGNGFIGLDGIQYAYESPAYGHIAFRANDCTLCIQRLETHAIGMFNHGFDAIGKGLVGVESNRFGSPELKLFTGIDGINQTRNIGGLYGIGRGAHKARSEEHTSELQSLMRISYAVFCLKKQTQLSDMQVHMTQ